jgi:hypothetical protein
LCVRAAVDCQPRSNVFSSVASREKRSTNGSDNAPTDSRLKKKRLSKAASVDRELAGVEFYDASRVLDHESDGQIPEFQKDSAPQPPRKGSKVTSPSKPRTSPRDSNLGGDISAMSLARTVFGQHESSPQGGMSDIPGGTGHALASSDWMLQSMEMPAPPVVEALLGAYFDRAHWFILLFHETSFLERAHRLLAKPFWCQEDAGSVLTILMVAAVGAQCVLDDKTWSGYQVLKRHSADSKILLDQIISEARLHLVDILEDCKIETVQFCILLGTFYIYHGSPNLAWSVLGMSSRTAYALALHRDPSPSEDRISVEVRWRCWNHVKVAETFAAMIYGRPASVSPLFSLSPLPGDCEDVQIPHPLVDHPALNQMNISISMLTFHNLKFKLYDIVCQTISSFRLLHLDEDSRRQDFGGLLQSNRHNEALLAEWRGTLPPFFEYERWQSDDPFYEVEGIPTKLSRDLEKLKRILVLQAVTLQVLYDSTIILIHRPVLEYSLSSPHGTPGLDSHSMSYSLDASVNAALRISRTPFSLFEKELSVSFVLMHFFIAGVILCIPPTKQPFSVRAQEAKLGVLRIIRASKTVKHRSQIARHAQQLLTELIKITIQREMASALDEEKPEGSHGGPSTAHLRLKAPGAADLLGDEPDHVVHRNPHETHGLVREDGSYGFPASMDHTETFLANDNEDLDVFTRASVESYSAQDNTGNEPLFDFQMDQHFNEVFGAFGQVMFNLVPDDRYTAWSWGQR